MKCFFEGGSEAEKRLRVVVASDWIVIRVYKSAVK
jgi:hypothetical protein